MPENVANRTISESDDLKFARYPIIGAVDLHGRAPFVRSVLGKCSVDSDTALRFGHWFGVDPLFWLNLQMQFDLVVADQQVGAAVRALPTAEGII